MPAFPSTEWFDSVRRVFNSDDSTRQAGGGTCDARVGIQVGDRVFLLVFEGFECASASEISDSELEATDFYMSMHPSDWEEMVTNIRVHGGADLDHTLNTIDLGIDDGLAVSWSGDQYRQDLFYRYNQTFQYFFDASSKIVTDFSATASIETPPD